MKAETIWIYRQIDDVTRIAAGDVPRVVKRWQAVGAEVLNTATAGAVYFGVCAETGVIAIGRERERRRRFWHAAT